MENMKKGALMLQAWDQVNATGSSAADRSLLAGKGNLLHADTLQIRLAHGEQKAHQEQWQDVEGDFPTQLHDGSTGHSTMTNATDGGPVGPRRRAWFLLILIALGEGALT